MRKDNNNKPSSMLEDQDLYEEIMSETKRLRALDGLNQYLENLRKNRPEPPEPVSPEPQPAAPEIEKPAAPPEVAPPPQRPAGSEISARASAAPSRRTPAPELEKKKKKGFSWFRKKKDEAEEWAAPPQNEKDDIYYGLKLKPIEEYKKEYEESGRSQQVNEPTSSFSYLFDRTEQLPDLTQKFEELHKERQERVAQATLEAGVETDDIFSLCKEKSDLDFDYDEWKRNTQSIPVIREQDAPPSAGEVPEPPPPEVSEPPAVPPEPVRQAAPEPVPETPAPPAPQGMMENIAAPGQDTLQFRVLNRFPNGLNQPDTRLPVDLHPADSIEAKELEVEQLIQQALNQVKSTSSIFERVARAAQEDILQENPPDEQEATAIAEIAQSISDQTQQEALADIEQTYAQQAEPPAAVAEESAPVSVPVPEQPMPVEEAAEPAEPVERYRFHQSPVRIFKLTHMDQVVEDEIKNFTSPPAALNPAQAPSPEELPPEPDTAEADAPPAPEQPTAEDKPEPPPSPAAGEEATPKVIQIPLKEPELPLDTAGEMLRMFEEDEYPPDAKKPARSRKQSKANKMNKFEFPPDGEVHTKKKRLLLKGEEEEDNDPEDEFQPPAPELEDYNGPEDTDAIALELNASVKELTLRMLVTGLCTAISVGLGLVFEWFLWNQNLSLVYLSLNLLFLLIPSAFCYMTLLHGVRSLVKLQASSDSSVAIALFAGIIQSVAMFFAQDALMHTQVHLYASLAVGALFLNTLGKFSMVHRIRKNFKFVTASESRCSVEMYEDYNIAIQLAKGCISETPHIAYQRKTRFLRGFLRNSYASDPSENTSQIIAPIAFVASLVLCIVCSIITNDAISGLTAFAIATCIATPITNMLCVNFPVAQVCRIARQNGAMMVGYQAIEAINEANAVMVDSTDLFPKGSISLSGMKTFGEKRIDRAILDASALMSAVGGTLREVFENVIQERKGKLPPVEGVRYEDNLGIIGWVAGKQILVGNREMLHKYKINPPDEEIERQNRSKSRQIIYLATERELVAMFILTYEPDRKMATEIQRLEQNGIAMIVRTLDPNLTPEFLASRFDLDPRAIHILPDSLGEYCDDALNEVSEEADVLLATRGKAYSMLRMLAACVRQKGNISIAVVLQTVSIILGFVLVAFFACCSAFGQLSTLSILIYQAFWVLTILLIPRIRKP